MLAGFQCRVGLLARRDIHQGTRKVQFTAFFGYCAGHHVKMLDGTVGH